MEFTKIKWDGKAVRLEWRTQSGEDHIEHGLSSNDEPEQLLVDALAAFVPEVLRILRLPLDYGDDLRVTGLSINYEEGEVGCVVTGLKKLPTTTAPLVLNTPHLREYNEHGPAMSQTMARLIGEAQAAARRYVDGHRAQGDLFDAAVEAVANLAPNPGSGFDSVTISSPGHPVTLTAEDGERARGRLQMAR